MLERRVSVRARQTRDPLLEARPADLFHTTAAAAAEMVVVRGRACRVPHAPSAVIDGVDTRQHLSLDKELERAEHRRTSDAASRQLSDELLRGERLGALEGGGYHLCPRCRTAMACAPKRLQHDSRRRCAH